jgi:hypothetical protein
LDNGEPERVPKLSPGQAGQVEIPFRGNEQVKKGDERLVKKDAQESSGQ